MKSEKEKLLNTTYDKFIQTSLSDLPLDDIDDLVDQDVMGYGTASDEKVSTISEYRKMIERQREQGENVDMKVEIDSVFRKISKNLNSAVFVDEGTITMTVNNETHQLFLRISTVLEYQKDKWIVVHFHGSKPEYADGEKDTWHINELNKKNEELERKVESKTADLEIKNNELKIEASLERIRTVAMSMQKAEGLLDVVEILYGELKTLGFTDIRNSIINIFNDTKEIFLNYDYSDYGVGGISEVDYNSHPSNSKFVIKMREASQDFMITEFTGNKLDEWRKWRIDEGQMPDPKLDQAESLYYYEYSIGVGSIGISTFSPINEDQLEILKKTRNVFDLAYRRYADIAQAEAYAREAQIEASLERVRAVVLSMKEASDMLEMCRVISEQLDILNVADVRNIQTAVINETKGTFLNYEYYGGHDKSFITEIDYQTHPTQTEFIKQMLTSSDAFFSKHFKRSEFKNWLDHQRETDQFIDTHLEVSNSLNYYFHSIGSVALGVSTYSPLNNEDLSIFKRFRNVFELAYRRFIDIEIAMEQAKEAQIEAALERVRARAMALHHTNELREVIAVLFVELEKLGFELYDSNIVILDKTTREFTFWGSGLGGVDLPPKFTIPFLDHTILNQVYFKREKGKKYREIELKGKELKSYHQVIINETEFKNAPKEYLEEMLSVDEIFLSHAYMKHGMVEVAGSTSLPEEHVDILQRFTKVFEQAYTRFLDVQKAESQAREAQIEAALERVRSKTMAMHNSDDVGVTVSTLFDEVLKLGLDKSIRCGIGILEGTEHMETWSATSDPNGEVDLKMGMLDMTIHPMLIEIKKAWERSEAGYTYQLIGDDVTKYYNALNKESEYPFFKDMDSFPEKEFHNSFFFSEGILFSFTLNPISEEAAKVLNRFASVFGQTYRRYLDLQTAEAQNIIIQAENERKSEELEEARQLQLAMLPKELPILQNLEIAVYMQTATEVGGDYYDFHVGNDGTLTAVVGDATGHGMKAGTMVTITKSLFDTLASEENILDSFSKISSIIKGMKFRHLSMCLTMLKIKEKRMIFSSAAMPPIMIFRKGIKKVEEINLKGMPLGTFKDFPYQQAELELNSNDVILLMSDGFPELLNSNNEMFGYERTQNLFKELATESAEKIISKLKEECSKWIKEKDLIDDVTFVVIKIK